MKLFCGVQNREVKNTWEVVCLEERMRRRKNRIWKRQKIESAKVAEKGKRWWEKKSLIV